MVLIVFCLFLILCLFILANSRDKDLTSIYSREGFENNLYSSKLPWSAKVKPPLGG